jgi:hypothetical protein
VEGGEGPHWTVVLPKKKKKNTWVLARSEIKFGKTCTKDAVSICPTDCPHEINGEMKADDWGVLFKNVNPFHFS